MQVLGASFSISKELPETGSMLYSVCYCPWVLKREMGRSGSYGAQKNAELQAIVSAGNRRIDRQAEVSRIVTTEKAMRNSYHCTLTVTLLLRRKGHPNSMTPSCHPLSCVFLIPAPSPPLLFQSEDLHLVT